MLSIHALPRGPRPRDVGALVASVTAIAVLTTLYVVGLHITHPTIVALSFLLVVLIVSTVSTRWVAIATSLMAFGCYNFFFLPPVGTFTIADPQNWVALFTLLTVSIVASHLSFQVRRRAQEATARRDELARLFDLTRDILLTTDTDGAVALVARSIARRFALNAVTICLPDGGSWTRYHAAAPPLDIDVELLNRAFSATRARLESDEDDRADSGHDHVLVGGATGLWLVPLRVGRRAIGLLALGAEAAEPGTRDAIAGVTAIAIERTHLLEERGEAEVVRRGAELKSALLASLSHDLKTPLTAVTVAANNLNASWLTAEQRHEQAEIVRVELERLNDLFQDIVDMARIETHAIAAEPEWVQPAEIVEAAARQVERALGEHTLDLEVRTERVLVRVDPRLTSSALAHVLENAGQYSPPDSPITVRVIFTSGELQIMVRDRGAGIAEEDLGHVFERAFRGTEARQRRFGTGMGLAITRGLLAAAGGRIWAGNHTEGGAVFTIVVPSEGRPAVLEGESV